MSRLGKKPVIIPDNVTVKIEDAMIYVNGPKGNLSKSIASKISVKEEDQKILVTRNDDTKTSNMNQGLMRSLINNMVMGVTEGYMKELYLEAREYKVAMEGTGIKLNIGYSHPVEMKAPDGIQFSVPSDKRVIVQGINKELVGQIAANIRKLRKWEPYTNKGIKYKDEKVRKKERKTGV